MQKSQKKKKKKKFLWDVFPCGFSISSDKKGGKSKWFCLFPKGERKSIKKIIRKRKKIVPSFGKFFDHFWSLVRRKRLLGSVSEVRRRSREGKKSNFKTKVLSAFFRHNVSEKRSVCG